MSAHENVTQLLVELEQRWRRLDAPILGVLQEGLSEGAIDTRTRTIGLHLPDEARAWWMRHDGAVPRDGASTSRLIGGGLEWITLDEAVRGYQRMRSLAHEAATSPFEGSPDGQADYWWHPMWFPLAVTGSGGLMACDCSTPPDSVTPIRWIEWGSKEDFHEPVADSLATAVRWWIEAIDDGAWLYDDESSTWRSDLSRVPPERALSRLI